MENVYAVILASGKGTRMGENVPKQYMCVAGKKVLEHTLEAFRGCKIVLVVDRKECAKYIDLDSLDVYSIVDGGESRFHSSMQGILSLEKELGKGAVVFVQDSARPCIDKRILEEGYTLAKKYGAAIPVNIAKEAVKKVDADGFVEEDIDRKNIVFAQTPQCFMLDNIYYAYMRAKEEKEEFFLDDASVYSRYIGKVKCFTGSDKNIKITVKEDLDIVNSYLKGGDFICQ